jgi:hypothetical protein
VQCIALSVLQWRHYRRIGGIGCFGEDAVSRALAVCVGMPVSTFRSLQTDSRASLAGTRQLSAYSWYKSFSTNGACARSNLMLQGRLGHDDGNMWRSQFGKDSNTEAEGRVTGGPRSKGSLRFAA